jgi:hypothetical protein
VTPALLVLTLALCLVGARAASAEWFLDVFAARRSLNDQT